MAAQASILLLAALCIGAAYSLQCYTCVSATSNSKCMTPTTCSSTEGYCKTIVGSATVLGLTGTLITKSCAESCTATNDSALGVASDSTSCCTTDLCNTSGANIKSSYSFIVLVVGTLVMVIGSSLL